MRDDQAVQGSTELIQGKLMEQKMPFLPFIRDILSIFWVSYLFRLAIFQLREGLTAGDLFDQGCQCGQPVLLRGI